MALEEAEGGTKLTYEAKADIGGTLAQLGSRLVQGTAKKLSANFFACLAEQVSEGARPPACPPMPFSVADGQHSQTLLCANA